MSEFVNILEATENVKSFQPLFDIINTIMEAQETELNETTLESITGMITGAMSPNVKKEAITTLIQGFEEQGYTRSYTRTMLNTLKQSFEEYINSLQPSPQKRKLIDVISNIIYELFDSAIEQYHNYDIELPIQLEEGARVPTYAHETGDVAADLYAADTVVVSAHSISNMIRTGVHIALPEGWAAYIVPRSSIGAKTPLRLSNSVGVIDSSYRGPLGVLYDNISDSDYTINAGDRIAQLIVMPSYRFKPRVVDGALDETERGHGGFGSTGK